MSADRGSRRGLAMWPEAAVLAGLVVAPFLLPHLGFGADLMSRILIWGLFGLGFDLLFGYTGLLSFGQAAFFGVGGFVCAYQLSGSSPNMLLALLLGILVAAVAGLVIGFLTLRRTGIYFAMSTLAFAEMFYFLENSPLKAYTGGENGIAGIPTAVLPLGFTTLTLSSGWPMYAFIAGFYFVGYVIARRIVHSPFGAVLTAIRGNTMRAGALGHSTQAYKLAVFVIAAMYGGLAGGLLGVFQSYMPPDAFMLDTSSQLVIQTVIGGAGTLLGPVLGAAIWLGLYEGLQHVQGIGGFWKLILGLVFVVLITLFRHGVAGVLVDGLRRRQGRKETLQDATMEVVSAETLAGNRLELVPASGAQGGPVLQARGITKQYGGLVAVSDVDFALQEGEIRGVIGPNGAGKSTFFKMLAGEVLPTKGSVALRGEDITGAGVTAVCHRGMSKSYQINQLFESLTVRQNMVIPALARERGRFRLDVLRRLAGMKRAATQAEAAIELVGLVRVADVPVRELSYGEKRRLEIGLALATGANVLLFDEPLAGLGPEERAHVIALLKAIRGGRTMVIVEHDMDAMFELAERITVLYEGRKLAEGTPAEIQQDPAVQGAYLGGLEHEPA